VVARRDRFRFPRSTTIFQPDRRAWARSALVRGLQSNDVTLATDGREETMLKLVALTIGIALLQVGCDDDDDDDDLGGEVIPDAPETPTGTERTFQVLLSGSEEVPACAAAGFYATGAATVIISADETNVTAGALRISDLSSVAMTAHIHAGPPGIAGPIVFDLTRLLSTPSTSITFNASNYPSPVPAGAPPTFTAFIADMKAGRSYINVHTVACTAGEIRGQLR
jgi:hypothetical protein